MTTTDLRTAAARLLRWAARARQSRGIGLDPFHCFDGDDGPELRVSDIEAVAALAQSDTPDLRTALNRMLWRRSGKGAWCVFCMADTGNDHEPDCPTIEVHAALAQSEGEEINRLAREKLHRSGKNLVPEDTPAPTR
jgi:hypothetical protein